MFGMSRFAKKFNIQNCEYWTGNCVHYMHGMSGLAEKLNIPNYIYSMGNCVHYIHTKYLNLQKNWISRTTKIQWEIVYNMFVRNVRICWKIKYPKLRKFIEKLCTLCMYGISGFAKISNIHIYKNSAKNCVRYICTEHLDFLKNWISRTAKIEQEIVYIIHIQNGWI